MKGTTTSCCILLLMGLLAFAPKNAWAITCMITDKSRNPIDEFYIGDDDLYITVHNEAANDDSLVCETVTVDLYELPAGDSEEVTLTEIGPDEGIFQNKDDPDRPPNHKGYMSSTGTAANNDILETSEGTDVKADYGFAASTATARIHDLIWPIAGDAACFGNMGRCDFIGCYCLHRGLDIKEIDENSDVRAVQNGTITSVTGGSIVVASIDEVEFIGSPTRVEHFYSHISDFVEDMDSVDDRVYWGEAFAKINESYLPVPHVDLSMAPDGGDFEDSINPLEMYLGELRDPVGDAPEFGPHFFKVQGEDNYEFSVVDGVHVLRGDVDIVVEIRDKQGQLHPDNPSEDPDDHRLLAMSSVPYKVSYWIDGPGDHDKGSADQPLVLCTFSSVPQVGGASHSLSLAVYDKNKKIDIGTEEEPDVHMFCFIVTNTGADDSQCWDTDKKDAAGNELYPKVKADGTAADYVIHVIAEDLGGNVGEETITVRVDQEGRGAATKKKNGN